MASSLTLKIGAFTASYTPSSTDAQVIETLRTFAWATGAPVEATDAQLADHVLRQWAQYAVNVGRQYRQAQAAKAAVIDTVDF